jgi:uncharacterized protein YabE (DUF348 family)
MNRPILITLIVISVVAAITLGVFELYKTVNIVVEGQEYPVSFWGITVKDALADSQIPIFEADFLTPGLEDPIKDGEIIIVKRAAWVLVLADGIVQKLWTVERKPDLILRHLLVEFGPEDSVLWNGTAIDTSEELPYAPTHSLQLIRGTTILLNEDGVTQTIHSTADLLGEALTDAGIQLHNSDLVTPALTTPLNGQDIDAEIQRSREIVIKTKDQVIRTRVLGSTVGDVLQAAGMSLQGSNYSIPPEDHPIPQDGKIQLVQVQEEIILEQNPIPFTTQFQLSEQVDLDTQQVIQVGEFGLSAQRIKVVYEDDVEISRTVEDEWIAKNSKPRIIGYGTKISTKTVNTPNGKIEYWRAVDVYATSYSPCRLGVPGKCSNRTATGAELKKGVIGVIRSWYNNMRGLLVYIPGYGYATIEDIGGGFSDRHWVDLGYSDNDFVNWSGYVTLYFLTPVPANIMYILD